MSGSLRLMSDGQRRTVVSHSPTVAYYQYTVGGPIKGPAIKGPFPKKMKWAFVP